MGNDNIDLSTDYKAVTLKFVDGTVLEGKINILPHQRVSDFLNSKDKSFVVVVESASQTIVPKTIFINKSEVTWIEPEEFQCVGGRERYQLQSPSSRNEQICSFNSTEVSFSAGALCFPAMLENISVGGARVSNKGLPIMMPGTEIAITIPFAAKHGSVKRKATVMWAEDGQFGIQFA